MPFPSIFAGQRLTAQNVRDMQWDGTDNGTAQIVNNSTTLVNTNLVTPLVAGAIYYYLLLVSYQSSIAADIQFAWTVPLNGSVERFASGVGRANTEVTEINTVTAALFRRPATATGVIAGGTTTGFTNNYQESGRILAGVGGTAVLQFAQGTATAVDTTVTASSRLDWLRIA